MDIIVKYIDELLEKSTPDAPMWNIEKIRQGLTGIILMVL